MTDDNATHDDTERFRHAWQEIKRLRYLCAEVYQVVGSMAYDLGVFETSDHVEKVLDNLSYAANGEVPPHKDLLPFDSRK